MNTFHKQLLNFRNFVLDSIENNTVALSPLEKMDLLIKVEDLLQQCSNNNLQALDKLDLLVEIDEICQKLGLNTENLETNLVENNSSISNEISNEISEVKNNTSNHYNFSETRTQGQRKKYNQAAREIVKKYLDGDLTSSDITAEQKNILAKYSGCGGGLVNTDGKKGSAYEYYTPKPIAEGIWNMLKESGFSGGKVLDPCAGTGIFGATAPSNVVIDAVELDETSGTINKLVNDGVGYSTTISPFEAVAAKTPDNIYDAVVTNVPFGTVADRGGNNLLDTKYQKEPLQNYFILRSLEKLKPNGVAVFITPPRCVSGNGAKEKDLRIKASYLAEFKGAYRLPNSVFGTAAADTMTDVIMFKKHSEELLEKIDELKSKNPDVLKESNILFEDFIKGKYFTTEGKKFVLGEFVPKDPKKFRDVDRVVTNKPVGEIAAMLRKFPPSRINYSLLDAIETEMISYKDGDSIYQNGEILELKNGAWQKVATTENAEDKLTAQKLAIQNYQDKVKTPYDAFQNNISFDEVKEYFNASRELAPSQIPEWIYRYGDNFNIHKAEDWEAVKIAESVLQILNETTGQKGLNYLQEYEALSTAMQQNFNNAKKIQKVYGTEALKILPLYYTKKNGFSNFWKGEIQTEVAVAELDNEQSYENLRYKSQSVFVDINEARKVFGNDFNPLTDDNYYISADGKTIAKIDDILVGKVSDVINKINNDIKATTSEEIRNKLLHIKNDLLNDRIDKINPRKLSFNLFSPLIPLKAKLEFCKGFIDPSARIELDTVTGKKYIAFKSGGANKTDEEKIINRITAYMKSGNISLGGIKVDSMKPNDAIRMLREKINTANEQFDTWCKSNEYIMAELEAVANDTSKQYFKDIEDESPLNIPGLNPELKLHTYQNSFVRKMGRSFGGGNGDGVGLGKTFQGLAAVQYAQSIGVKKKTLFVVPNSVLSNWRKEATRAYTSIDDCLFVGLREKGGKFTVNSANFDADLTMIKENRHKKIFMTLEAFERIKLKTETISDYEHFMRQNDNAFATSLKKAEDVKKEGKVKTFLAPLYEKKGAAPYLEDLGVDSLVFDEAHVYKNSAQSCDFNSAKYLSLTPASKRGIDVQCKAWYIRNKNKHNSGLNDGVLLLTATPITNSPLEIYSMLVLAGGVEKINDMSLGIKGADHFLELVCNIESQELALIDGILKEMNVFTGLRNIEPMRNCLHNTFTARSAENIKGINVVIPDRDEDQIDVNLPEDVIARLKVYKNAYRYAADTLKGKEPNAEYKSAFDEIQAFTHDSQEIIGHPFNLINKMTMLIADKELEYKASFYYFDEANFDLAQKVMDEFNTNKLTEARRTTTPYANEEDIVSERYIEDENNSDRSYTEYKWKVRGLINKEKNQFIIDSISPDAQNLFEQIAEKHGLNLSVTIPPKIAALLENVKHELANKRGVKNDGTNSNVVKQIIFCDILPLHNKIKRLLTSHCGISSSKIAIITGQTNNSPDEILAVQDGFNAEEEDNVYNIVIANEKAEVGINLQKGTQAIHHLTIGWTPDSLEQRNGRGARQGNKTEFVKIYYYDADGTFDTVKRNMVNKKSDWISTVMQKNGENTVEISGGLSNEKMNALISAIGDKSAIARIEKEAAENEKEQRRLSTIGKQLINLDQISKAKILLETESDFAAVISTKLRELNELFQKYQKDIEKVKSSKSTQAAKDKKINGILNFMDDLKKEADIVFESYALENGNRFYANNEEELKTGLRNNSVWYFKEPTTTINKNSKFYKEWQNKITMNKNILANATKSFKEYSKNENVIPEEVIDNDFRIIHGLAFTQGAFIDKNKKIAQEFPTSSENNTLYCVSRFIYDSGADYPEVLNLMQGNRGYCHLHSYRLSQLKLKQSDIILPGSAKYIEYLKEAAAFDDNVEEGAHTYSDYIPAVYSYRNQNNIVSLLPDYKGLLDSIYLSSENNCFPYILSEYLYRSESDSAFVRQILKEQANIVNYNKEHGRFYAKVKIKNIDASKKKDKYDCFVYVMDYVKAHNILLTDTDIDNSFYYSKKDYMRRYFKSLDATIKEKYLQNPSLIPLECFSMSEDDFKKVFYYSDINEFIEELNDY